MRINSVAFRIVASASVISIIILLAAGLNLRSSFQQGVELLLDKSLKSVMDNVLARVDLNENNELIFEDIDTGVTIGGDARSDIKITLDNRFVLPDRGWYWQVMPVDGSKTPNIASQSLLERRLELPDKVETMERDDAGLARFYMTDINGERLRVLEARYTLFGKKTFSFVVTGNVKEAEEISENFDNIVILSLAVLFLVLPATLVLQIRFALRPLANLRAELSNIREGKSERIDGTYPTEIQPVSDELNLLVEANTKIVERARTQVGNLAHALKTPLSVLTNEAGLHDGALSGKVTEQTGIMRDQVNMYLDRARREARAQTRGVVTDTRDVIDSISRTLQKINIDRGIEVDIDCPENYRFRGERQDLEEMLGNLLDNAFKWTKSRVSVDVTAARSEKDDGRIWLNIVVGDDGPGLPEDRRDEALKRGQRLDETKPGSGLGLSIVCETAGMYNGDLTLDRSQWGGLQARLKLPAAVN